MAHFLLGLTAFAFGVICAVTACAGFSTGAR